ncbi:V-type proton ATPase subunit d2-like [Zingiber officinale]|uniref:V-type proton ATPase subunit d2-like n=1 Tax=Zingiber officinale TaxID=94328 RepID=UPI001C4CE65C|nr:V-type proton ATPase subunit d2-like [Zingiber officinale]
MYGFEALTFNVHGGYLEAIVRGYRSGLLTAADYNNLCQCETLDDVKMHLSATEYGPYLQNEPSPLHTTTIVEKCTLKLVDEYKHMLCQATEPLSTFLEYITYGYMIDNVVLIVTGTLHERDVQELLEKCHPLGMFDRYVLSRFEKGDVYTMADVISRMLRKETLNLAFHRLPKFNNTVKKESGKGNMDTTNRRNKSPSRPVALVINA